MSRPPLPHEDLAAYAHELRGALTVIAGYTELLRRPLGASQRAGALDGIERAIRRADSLTTAALAGRAPAATGRVSATVSLGELAEQVVADQRSATGRVINLAVDDNVVVLGDEDALSRALGNLIDNAAKYSPRESPIEVTIAEEPSSKGRRATIEVADRGPGIDEFEVRHIAEPGVRLKRDAALPGDGLGLSIVRGIAALHDGSLSVITREGGGTIVRLELPSL